MTWHFVCLLKFLKEFRNVKETMRKRKTSHWAQQAVLLPMGWRTHSFLLLTDVWHSSTWSWLWQQIIAYLLLPAVLFLKSVHHNFLFAYFLLLISLPPLASFQSPHFYLPTHFSLLLPFWNSSTLLPSHATLSQIFTLNSSWNLFLFLIIPLGCLAVTFKNNPSGCWMWGS